MASAFKRGGKWYAKFRGVEGWERKAVGRDKAEAERIAGALELQARWRREGLVDPKADALAAAEVRPIGEHVEDFRQAIASRRGNEKYATLTRQRVARVLRLGGVETLSDVSPAAVDAAVRVLREGREAHDGVAAVKAYSKAGIFHHLRAVKMFSRWLLVNGRTRDDALFAIKVGVTVNKSERVRVRRALAQDEFTRLVQATRQAGALEGMGGADRAKMYELAAGTGFRAGELASLTPDSFDLGGDSPAVAVKAAYSKRKKDDRQPITPELAAVLAPWLATKPKGKPVFAMPPMNHLAKIIRADMRRARAAWILEAAGRKEKRERQQDTFLVEGGDGLALVDLHTLRVSYISWLVESGASVKTCQELARHSTPTLTIGVYAKMSLHDQGKALAGLPMTAPKPTADQSEVLRATGTFGDTRTETKNVGPRVDQTPGNLGNLKMTRDDTMPGGAVSQTPTIYGQKTQKPASIAGFVEKGRSGIRTHESRICNPLH